MTLKQLKNYFAEELKTAYPKEELFSFFDMLSFHYLGFSRAQAVLEANKTLAVKQHDRFMQAIDRLKKNEPIQYIIGHAHFYGLSLKVTPDTLIPRPETEELVEWILKDARGKKGLQVLDLCTGSGCIALALALNLNESVVKALDLSKEALEVAQQNAASLEATVQFVSANILTESPSLGGFDVMVSNPPYVRNSEKKLMAANVLDFEPNEALFVSDQNPLLFYQAIGQYAIKYLNKGGVLYLEINEYLSEELMSLLRSLGFTQLELKNDLYNKPRMIKCSLNESNE